MPIDTSIYNTQQPRSAIDYSNEYAKADAMRNANALQAISLRQATQADQERNALRAYLSSGADLSSADGIAKGYAAAPTQFGPIAKSFQDRLTSQAQATKDTAQAGNFDSETAARNADIKWKLADRHAQQLNYVQTPEDAVAYIDEGIREGSLPMQGRDRAIAMIQQNGVQAWKQMAAQAAIPTLEKYKQDAEMARTKLTTDTQVQTTGMNNATSRANTATTQAGENSRAAQSRATQLRLGGYDANGNLLDMGLGTSADATPGKPGAAQGASPYAGLIDSIGTYKSPESVALGRVPPAIKAQVLQAVMQKYPDYDPSTFGAKQKAARDFTSGQQGNALRSFAVAGQHLDQLGTLVDALDNGNVQIINKIGNQIGAQLGSTAPTNFDAAKDVVSKEVTKAIVGSGGGVGERAELAHLLSDAKTPAQLKGVITQYRGLMSAQHDALMQQRQAAGLPDSTLPGYSQGTPMAPGAFKITHVDGQPQ